MRRLTPGGNTVSEPFNTPTAADLTAFPTSGPPFYTVSLVKLTVMMFITCGLYGLYWFYKNWSRYKAYSAKPIWPVLRTVFCFFYIPSLFSKVNAALRETGLGGIPYWGAYAAGIYLLAFTPSIVTGYASGWGSSPSAALGIIPTIGVYTVTGLGQFLITLRVQSFINRLDGKSGGGRRIRFTFGDVVWAVTGICYWALLVQIYAWLSSANM
jgi:hypothetical protein